MDWQDIKGHLPIKRDLRELLQNGRLPHALLFTGIEGIGKSLTAQVLAKALLCQSPSSDKPCGSCRSCRAFEEGTHPDFFYIKPDDSKSVKVIKIEQIRQMQSLLSLSPDLSARRAVIIDGAEFMNDAAVNSLLKTLEEPPGEIYFILVTANKDMLLPTILSRCTKIYFAPLDILDTAAVLQDRFGVDKDHSTVLSRLSGGSISRAAGLIGSTAPELRQKALSLLSGQMTDEEILQAGDEFFAMERTSLLTFASFLQLLVRDLLLLSGGASPELLCNVDIDEKLRCIAAHSPKNSLLNQLTLTDELIKRLNTNADARLIIQNFLLQWRTLQPCIT